MMGQPPIHWYPATQHPDISQDGALYATTS